MNLLVVGFLVKLLDIPGAIIGLVGGWYSQRWLHLGIAAILGGSAGEVILYMAQDAREFSPIIWLVGVAACLAWAIAAHWIRSRFSKKN